MQERKENESLASRLAGPYGLNVRFLPFGFFPIPLSFCDRKGSVHLGKLRALVFLMADFSLHFVYMLRLHSVRSLGDGLDFILG